MTLFEWLQAEEFSLALSSGFFGFFAHAGFLQALHERELRPAAISGSSAGGLIAGCYAAGLAPEAIVLELAGLKKPDFWDPKPGLGLLKGDLFADKLRQMLPVQRFEDCAIPCAVSVFHIASRTTRILQDGSLVEAIVATCALPGLFHPARHATGLLWDGGIADRPGTLAFRGKHRVLHHHLESNSFVRSKLRKTWGQAPIWTQEGCVTVRLAGLPKSGPNKLAAGVEAMAQAKARAHRMLDMPVSGLIDG